MINIPVLNLYTILIIILELARKVIFSALPFYHT